MPSEIDRAGAYRGFVKEHGVGATKNGFPQFVGKFTAAQKWVDDKSEMESLGLTEPGWADWAAYEQDLTGYLVLFGNDKDNPGATKPTFQLGAVQEAFGWDGASFAGLATMDVSETLVTFWVEENEYNGTTSLKVSGVADGKAAPTRGLRMLDSEGLKDLDSRFAGMLASKKAAPAKAPAKIAAKAPAAPAPKAPAAPAAKPGPAKPSAPAASPTPAPKSAPSNPPATKTPDVAGQMTMDQAWEHASNNRNGAGDDTLADAWIAASESVAPGKDESTISPEDWGRIAKATIAALAS